LTGHREKGVRDVTVLKRLMVVALFVFFSAVLPGCEREGPLERAGERADEAVEETKDAFTKDGPRERAGEKVDDAVEDMKDTSR
jgi:hypothetical protein